MVFAHFHERLGNIAAGVVDEDVEPRERLDGLSHGRNVGDVGDDGMRPAAGGADLGSTRFDVLARAREEPHFGAGLRERDRAGAADAAAGAGDQRGAAVEAEAGGGVQGAAILNGVRPH